MTPEESKSPLQWFKENAINLLVTLFLIGGAYGGITVSNTNRDATLTTTRIELEKSTNRIEALEKQLIGLTIQQQTDHGNISVLSNDSKQLQVSVGKIEAQIDVVNNKLDNVAAELHRLSNKLDEKK